MVMMRLLFFATLIALLFLFAACAPEAPQQSFQATPVAVQATAPIFPTATAPPTRTAIPPTSTPSPTATATASSTPTPSATPTLPPSPTIPLASLTPATGDDAPPAIAEQPAPLTQPEGWTCGDFPCEDDIDGFLRRIGVPPGFVVEHFGQFPGQPMQIAFGGDGRLYATVLENGTRSGAIYALNPDGSTERYAGDFISPIGLAFQPGTDVLYVSARLTPESGGVLYRVQPGRPPEVVRDDLPCCYSLLDNQPNGMTFGPDGWLYLGVGALTNRAEPPDPRIAQFATLTPLEASVLRIQPHTGEATPYSSGLRNPYDVAFDSTGRAFATDQGLIEGLGDRILQIESNGSYGFPYWRLRGCADCPFTPGDVTILPDLLPLPDYTLPRGITAYTGTQFPRNYFGSVFVALWNNVEGGQRVIRLEPDRVPTDAETLATYQPEAFVTGLIRPVDVVVARDGALLVADFIYGHVWRIVYRGE
jgi:glucose/arabinose dehydrogenase